MRTFLRLGVILLLLFATIMLAFISLARADNTTIIPLNPWTIDGSNNVTQRTVNAAIKFSGLTPGGCVQLTSLNVATTTGSPCGSGGGGSSIWPFTTTDTNYGVPVQSSTTPEWFKNGMMASTTSYFANSTTTLFTVSSLWMPGQSSGCAQFDSSAKLTSTGVNCGTGGGGGADPFTHVSVYGQTTGATSTMLALTGSPFSLVASSTVNFVNASTTALTILSNLYLPSIATYQLLETDGNKNVIATTSIGWNMISGAPAIPAGANPTASVGATAATNGSAATFMRSDAVPGCTAATALVPGCLAAADWTTFNSKLNFSNLFTIGTTYSTTSLATTTAFWFQGGLNASSTPSNPSHIDNFLTNNSTTTAATTTSMAITSVKSALYLANANGSVIPYGGATTCSNQFFTAFSALGASTCTSVTDSFFSGQLGVAHGGTGKDFSALSGVLTFNTGVDSLYATSSTGFYASGGSNGNVLGITNGVVGWVATSSGAGGSPAGSGTEFQYRNGGSFGAVTSSAYGSATGLASFGTTTPSWALLTIGTSTAPQLSLADNIIGDALWVFRNIAGNLFIATSTQNATSTGYIEFPSNGGCVGCSDIILTGGINLRNAKYVISPRTTATLNTFATVYTAPAGRRAFIYGALGRTSAASPTVKLFYTASGLNYALAASSTINSTINFVGVNVTPIILEPGEGITVFSSSSLSTVQIFLIEFDSSVPFYSPKNTGPSGNNATTTLYTVPAGSSAACTALNPFAPVTAGAGNQACYVYFSNQGNGSVAVTGGLFNVTNGESASFSTNEIAGNNTTLGALNATTQNNIAAGNPGPMAMNSGDTLQFELIAVGTNSMMIWTNVYEH